MISFIRGELAWLTENSVVIDCGGIGYEAIVPSTVLAARPRQGEEMLLYTYLQVREDGVSLFGFASREELNVFRMLIGVSGIGPKGAVGILSAVPVDDLRFAILSEDEKTIARAPGIGAKRGK
ncbi:MAG: Holliday junction branch migration protein RuvA [Lachnospiraceae bacterium]|nr:Holliday junction branch migration protein RuvA [Lachnospiraceae bacterium]